MRCTAGRVAALIFTMIPATACGRFGFAPQPEHVDATHVDDVVDDGSASLSIDGPVDSGPRLVFTTPTAFLGGVGTLADLDTQCTMDANGAGHAGTFRVVLATVGSDPTNRIILDQGRTIERVDGAVVATDSTFFTASHSATLDLDVTGATITITSDAWTNFSSEGVAQASDCTGWTDSSNGNFGGTGSLTAIDSTWANSGTARCNRVAHLICIEQ